MKRSAIAIALSFVLSVSLAQSPMQASTAVTRHGPEKGTLIIIGGNVGSTASIWNKFTEMAGGKDKAKIVVITTGAGEAAKTDQNDVDTVKKYTGVKNVVMMHTFDLKEANSEKFIAPRPGATIFLDAPRSMLHAAHTVRNLPAII